MSSTSLPRLSLPSQAETLRRSLAGRIVLCIAASVFVALCAHISLPMLITPVPVTMQTLAVILVGMGLGPVEGFAALTLYLIEGASGLPVFSPHGLGGVAQLLGPTAGYLFSYPLAAAISGACIRLLRHRVPVFVSAIGSGLLAMIPIFLLGAAWLAHVLGLTGLQAFHLAVVPFLGVEALKLLAAAAAYSALFRRHPSQDQQI